MNDFRNYLKLKEGYDEHFFYHPLNDIEVMSPFQPIEIGNYIINLYASENDLCSPLINSLNPYDFESWEMTIEKTTKYEDEDVTYKIFNNLGYESFKKNEIGAYVPNDLVQEVFDYLTLMIKLPKFNGIELDPKT